MCDAFKYFDGGIDGVRKRFGEQIKSAMENMTRSEIFFLGKDCDNSLTSVVEEICRGNFSNVSKAAVDLFRSFGVTLNQGFGQFNDSFTDEDRHYWEEKAKEAQFFSVAFCPLEGGEPPVADQLAQLKVYVLLTAYELL